MLLDPASEGLDSIVARGTRFTDVRDGSGKLLFTANRQQLLALASMKNAILLATNSKGLRYVVLLITEKLARRITGIARGSRIPEPLPVAEDNRTSVLEGRTYKHVAHRCNAYDRIGLTPVDALRL